MEKPKQSQFIPWLTAGAIGFLAYREFLQINVLAYVGSQNIWASRRFAAFLGASLLSLAVYFTHLVPSLRTRAARILGKAAALPLWVKISLSAILLLLPGAIKWTLLLPENFTVGFWMEFFLIYLAAYFSSWLFSVNQRNIWRELVMISSFILAAGAAHSILFKLDSVTSYPFMLYWSEGNRFYDYSTLLGSFRYSTVPGETIKAFVTWGMQLPWAIPFVLPNLTIASYRLWNQFVWILPAFILGLIAIWQAGKKHASWWFVIAFALWTYLFLDQGPIYAPLVIGAIFTVMAVRQKLWLGAIIIFFTSYYTRSARWTWAYAPGIWAGMLAVMNLSHPTLKKKDWPNLAKLLILGIAGYLGGQVLPSMIRLFQTNADINLLPNIAASTSRQPLLWERLYPNPTYPPGILGGILWAGLPLVILLISLAAARAWRINWFQTIAVLAVTGIFLTIGIIASVKIGGGSNLHNLDLFLITLALLGGNAASETAAQKLPVEGKAAIVNLFLIAAMIAPVTYGMRGGARLELTDDAKIQDSLAAVRSKVEQYRSEGEILFIDHRQLLTFQMVGRVPLVDEYEKKYLMDQALSADADYFRTFYQDLNDQRFALIVNEPANIIIRGSEYSFGEENDAYVHWVTKPLLCAYEPIYTSFDTGLELLIPRENPPPVELNCQEVSDP